VRSANLSYHEPGPAAYISTDPANSTIKREFAALKRAIRLAARAVKVAQVPRFLPFARGQCTLRTGAVSGGLESICRMTQNLQNRTTAKLSGCHLRGPLEHRRRTAGGEEGTYRRADHASAAAGRRRDSRGRHLPTHGVSEATFYVWKKKYSGLALNELRELRQLREENTELKLLVADLSLDRHILQEIVQKSPEASPAARTGMLDSSGIHA